MNNTLGVLVVTLTRILTFMVTPSEADDVIKAIPVPEQAKPVVPAQISPDVANNLGKKKAAVSTMAAEELAGFESYPPALQDLVHKALELTTQNLRYQYGSSDPKSGGMDCSGTMYYLMQNSGFKDIPRQSDEICQWVMRHAV